MDSKKLLLPLLLLSAAMAWAGGIEAPPSAESVTGLKAWIEENVSAADVSAEIEGAVAAHAVATTTHGVSGVADVASVTEHVNATGTAVHGLGTMATEASTDYVATGTFTAHTDDASDPHGATLTQTTIVSDSVDGVDVSAHVTDNSDVHGCTAIASASAVADALSAANASDALNLRLDGSRAMTGSLIFSGNYAILNSSSDGTDDKYIELCAGGAESVARGALLLFYGNEYPTMGGQARYYAGNVSTGHHLWHTGNGSERMRLTYGGNLLIGTTTDDGTNKLQVNGSVSAAKLTSTRYMTVGQEFYPIAASGGVATFTALGTVSSTTAGHMYVVNTTSGNNAILYIAEGAVTKIAGNAAITHSKGTPSAVNVYVEGNYVMIQNNISLNRNVSISYSGMKN